MKKLLLLSLAALMLPSCAAFSKLTPEQQNKIIDRGLALVDVASGRIVGKVSPASGSMTTHPAK